MIYFSTIEIIFWSDIFILNQSRDSPTKLNLTGLATWFHEILKPQNIGLELSDINTDTFTVITQSHGFQHFTKSSDKDSLQNGDQGNHTRL